METSQLQRLKQRYGIVGNDDALNRALEIALKISPVDLSVLIMGENGVGKEIFPRVIHDHSLRKGKKYLAVNCGAIPDGTIDSELFGHEKGAFTGAVERREGYFAVADGGTLFLDEVGELPLPTQARLLRVLETGEYIPVGASEVKRTAATNVNMEKAIADGKFREDLFYRLNSVSINIPPLRQRGADVVLLFRKFALEMSEKYKMPPIRLTPEAQKMLVSYAWPGNVRQLKNIAENMSVTSEEREITPEILSLYLPAENTSQGHVVALASKEEPHSFEKEREFIYQMLFDLRREVAELKRMVGEKHLPMVGRDTDSPTSSSRGLAIYQPQPALARPMEKTDNSLIQDAEEVTDNDVAAKETDEEDVVVDGSLEEMERKSIKSVLNKNNGNRRLAAKQLGISERTLYRKIKEYDLE